MAKYFGKIGYLFTEETSPGVYEETIKPIDYYGDITRNTSRWQNGEGLNDNITINNQISILADPFAFENFQHIKYAEYLGAKWTVNSVEVQYPRLLLSLGGVYNEQTN